MTGRLPPEIIERVRQVRAARIRLAREDPSAFCEYVLRHERTGKPLRQAPMHEEWHRDISRHPRHIIWSHVEGGKTTQIAVGRPLYEIGRDPSLRCVILGNSHGAATKIVGAIARYAERSRELREVFPRLAPADPWNKTSLTFARPYVSKDPSIQALGSKGDVIGSRIDLLIIDDLLDYENTREPRLRLAMRDWFLSAIVGRLTDTARVAVIGNAYYSDDLLHWLSSELGYTWSKYPVRDADGRPRFADGWDEARIARTEEALGGKGSPEADRQLYCVARSDGSSRVQEGWIQACLARGEGLDLLEGLTPEDDEAAYTGVDLGVKKHARAAKSAICTIVERPAAGAASREACEYQIVGMRSGRWSAAAIVGNVLEAQRAYGSLVQVEDNGAQSFLVENIYEADPSAQLTILGAATGANKHHPVYGVEGIFAVMAQARLIIPSRRDHEGKLIAATPELRELVTEIRNYDPGTHTGDHLMSLWLAREASRRMRHRDREGVGVTVVGEQAESEAAERAAIPEDRREALEGWEAALRRPGRSVSPYEIEPRRRRE